jgi:serine/threonine protein kinase
MRPELAASVGPDRFLREIAIAAQLQHPHILPLLDSGDAGGFFYVMPFAQGESLRDRPAREHELPVHDALRIVTEVADVLARWGGGRFANGRFYFTLSDRKADVWVAEAERK